MSAMLPFAVCLKKGLHVLAFHNMSDSLKYLNMIQESPNIDSHGFSSTLLSIMSFPVNRPQAEETKCLSLIYNENLDVVLPMPGPPAGK